MDPLVSYATRNSTTFPVLTYDGRFVYEQDSYMPTLSPSTEETQNVYASVDLLQMLEEERNLFFVAKSDKIVFERANPFIKIPGMMKDVDVEMKTFQLFFNFQGTKIVLHLFGDHHIKYVLNNGILVEKPYNNLLVSLPMITEEIWMHFVYLVTKIYKRVTILQLAMSDVRYLIAMDYTGIPRGWREELKSIATRDSRELKKLFTTVPRVFSTWFTDMNNIHIAKIVENLILNKAHKDALDGGGIYTSMPSYDIKKVVNLLKGEPVIQEGVKSDSFKFLKEVDEEFVRGLHLYGEPENFSQTPLHTTININTDVKLKYVKGRKLAKGGIHWGQRKLLLSEIDFFTHFIENDEKVVAYYIGAAPFNHGPVLLNMFRSLTLILCDLRDVWHQSLRDEAKKHNPRVFLETHAVDEEYIRNLMSAVTAEGPATDPKIKAIQGASRVFFISDIRSTDPTEVGIIDNELSVHEDMTLQKQLAEYMAGVITSLNKQFVASFKFRLPFINEIGGVDYPYSGGILKTQPWSRMKSTELRLWWTPSDTDTTYNKQALEDIMMYHNSVLRDASFGSTGIPGYCECHDCHYEVHILKTYIKKFVQIQIDEATIITNHVLLFDAAFSMRLDEHATSNRRKVKDYMVERDNVTRALRYNPLVESLRSDLAFEHHNKCVQIMKAAPEFEGVKEEILSQIFVLSLLSGYYETGVYRGTIVPDIVNELCNVTMSESTIDKLNVADTQASERRDTTLKKPTIPVIDVSAKSLGHINKGFYNVTAASEKPVSTIRFHKSILRRFLSIYERKYDITLANIRGVRTVLCRVYSILKRLGPVWHDHLSYSLDNLWDAHPELIGFHNGGCLLSAHQEDNMQFSESYGVLIPELELGFSDSINILQLKHLIVNDRIVTIFAPPIRHLWTLFLDKAYKILDKYRDEDKVVGIVIPNNYIPIIPEGLLGFEHFASRRDYTFGVFDTINNKNVKLENHTIMIFRTPHSNFTLSD
jgi:hypothetical protein